ncbi:MAG: 5-deoxy-glucuronate isomerase, partial [Bifidobacteriaceae bacterium]|nr:5-deoxy-glucuronate isomerase [Bifidobacteriaceae bacterium]
MSARQLVVPAAWPAHGTSGTVTSITPQSAGWAYSGLEVRQLAAGAGFDLTLDGREALVLPLAGGVRVDLPDAVPPTPATVRLAGRPGPLSGPSDSLYLPAGTRARVRADRGPARVAVASAAASDVRADAGPAGPAAGAASDPPADQGPAGAATANTAASGVRASRVSPDVPAASAAPSGVPADTGAAGIAAAGAAAGAAASNAPADA